MYRLHTSPGSGGFAVQAMLEEAGVPYELVPVDTKKGEHRTPAFLKLNPMGQVPVLEAPGGRVMTESGAMVLLIADRHAPGRLAPAPASAARADFLRWLFFLAVNVYSSDLRVYYPERYTAEARGAEAVKQAAMAAMDREFAIIDKAIGNGSFVMGARYTALDPYLAMLASWHPDAAGLFRRCRNIARVSEKVQARRSIRKINAFHKLW
jgi:glutathione S-transferase